MGRLTRQLGSTHHCGTKKPANGRVLQLRGILALSYSPQHSTASLDNFDLWTHISTLINENCLLAIHVGYNSIDVVALSTLHWNAQMRFWVFKYLRIFVQQCKHEQS